MFEVFCIKMQESNIFLLPGAIFWSLKLLKNGALGENNK